MSVRDGDGRSVEEKGKSKCTEVKARLGGGVCVCVCVCVGVGVGVGVPIVYFGWNLTSPTRSDGRPEGWVRAGPGSSCMPYKGTWILC